MKDNSKWFVCECSGEAIRVEKYQDENITEFWFSLYRHGKWNPGIRWRIKAAFRVLIKGEIHEDQVIFSKETTDKLNNYLTRELT
jgi:hypothetical protein